MYQDGSTLVSLPKFTLCTKTQIFNKVTRKVGGKMNHTRPLSERSEGNDAGEAGKC